MSVASTGKSFWEGMTPMGRTIVGVLTAVAIAGTVGFVGYKIYHAIAKANADRAQNKQGKDVSNDLSNLQHQGVHPTLSQSQIDAIANNLEEAYQGYGSDFDSVKSNLAQVKNDADILSIIKSFGTRTISSGRFNPEPDTTGTLTTITTSELSPSQITELNELIHKTAGITFKF